MKMGVVERPKACISEIVAAVSAISGISEVHLLGLGRSASVARARQVCYFLASAEGYSLPQIGRGIGGRDHTTVLQGLRAVKAREDCPELQHLIASARLQLRVLRACNDRAARLRSKLLVMVHNAAPQGLEQMAAQLGVEA